MHVDTQLHKTILKLHKPRVKLRESGVNCSGSNLGEPRLEGVWLRNHSVHSRVFRPPDPAGDFDRRPGPGLRVWGLGGRAEGGGSGVEGLKWRVYGAGLRALGVESEFRV
jgi:hypothetical protein